MSDSDIINIININKVLEKYKLKQKKKSVVVNKS
jgi:hypothetical protein